MSKAQHHLSPAWAIHTEKLVAEPSAERREEEREGRTSLAPLGQEYVWAAVPSSSVFLFGNVLCTTNESTEEEGGEKETHN